MKNDFASILSSTLSHKGYYVVSFETVNETAETVIALEPLLKFVVVEVCGEVGKLAVLRPNLVASVQELIGEETCVHAEESAVLYADVVEAHVLWVALETTALLLVVGETVEVVVNGVVIDHLRDRQVPEERGLLVRWRYSLKICMRSVLPTPTPPCMRMLLCSL